MYRSALSPNIKVSNHNMIRDLILFCHLHTGSEQADTILTLTGTGFSATAAENIVMVGDTPCIATEATATQVKCALSPCQGGTYSVTVSVHGKGLARIENGPHNFKCTYAITSINPTAGGTAGKASYVMHIKVKVKMHIIFV